jgi:hypothetical protein
MKMKTVFHHEKFRTLWRQHVPKILDVGKSEASSIMPLFLPISSFKSSKKPISCCRTQDFDFAVSAVIDLTRRGYDSRVMSIDGKI